MGDILKVKSVWLNEADLKELQKLVGQGHYANVSDAIRIAIKDLIKYHERREGVAEADVSVG